MKVDLVLRAAEELLACCREDQKARILAQIKDIKEEWEDTVTYMTHCHRWGCWGPCQGSACSCPDPPCPPPPRPGASTPCWDSWERDVPLGFGPALPPALWLSSGLEVTEDSGSPSFGQQLILCRLAMRASSRSRGGRPWSRKAGCLPSSFGQVLCLHRAARQGGGVSHRPRIAARSDGCLLRDLGKVALSSGSSKVVRRMERGDRKCQEQGTVLGTQ